MKKLKSKLLAAITVVLILSIALASYGFAAAAPKTSHEKTSTAQKNYNSFTLTATGTATNAAHEAVTVSLSIEGNANGKIKTVFHINTQNGKATIEGYDTIYAVRGQGIMVYRNNFIHLDLMMSSDNYGGRSTLWVLRGTSQALTGNTMPVSLQTPRVVLPIEGHPQLTHLTLKGSISFQ